VYKKKIVSNPNNSSKSNPENKIFTNKINIAFMQSRIEKLTITLITNNKNSNIIQIKG